MAAAPAGPGPHSDEHEHEHEDDHRHDAAPRPVPRGRRRAAASQGHNHGHGHSHGHGHAHGPSLRGGVRHRRALTWSFVVIATVALAELVVGLATNSLALLSDAGHMVTDVLGLGMALAAITAAERASTRRGRSFGLYRLEILAALANAALLLGVAGYVLLEAIARIGDAPDLDIGPVLVVGSIGLVANIVAFVLLRPGAGESVNVQGAYLEVLADLLGSVGVVVGAVLIGATGWTWIDTVIGVGLGLWILPRTARLARSALRILVQAAPHDVDLDDLGHDLRSLPGVVGLHDLHVWTLTSGMDVASAHLVVPAGTDTHPVLDAARTLLADHYGIEHATFQVEPDDHTGCDDVTW